MRYLLDTHILLWWLNGDKNLKDSIQRIIKHPDNQIFISVATLWEISIKHILGKLTLKTNLSEIISVSGFNLIPITSTHILELEKLPLLHHDPFDRILIAQSISEKLVFITDDIKIKKYHLKVF